jgi:hypothetical protein
VGPGARPGETRALAEGGEREEENEMNMVVVRYPLCLMADHTLTT